MSIASNLLAVCMNVLFPEPVTPITAMKTSGVLPGTKTMIGYVCWIPIFCDLLVILTERGTAES